MDDYTKRKLELSQKTLGQMSDLLVMSMRGFTEGTPRHTAMLRKMQAYKTAASLMEAQLQGGSSLDATKDELEEALQIIDAEKAKIEYAPPKMDCCNKLKSLMLRQGDALNLASTLLSQELVPTA